MEDHDAPCLTERDLHWPDLPPELEGLRIAHLTDLHIRKPSARHDALIETLASIQPDLLAITGDLMQRRAAIEPSLRFVDRLTATVRPPLGYVGCYGNHDEPRLRAELDGRPTLGMRVNAGLSVPGVPMYVGAVDVDRRGEGGDLDAAMRGAPSAGFRLLLAHLPTWLSGAAEAGVHLVLSGHTHGGQIRLPGMLALETGCRWPRAASAGWFEQGRTKLILSRGLGESQVEGLRINCPRQIPLLTLRRGERSSDRPPTKRKTIERW